MMISLCSALGLLSLPDFVSVREVPDLPVTLPHEVTKRTETIGFLVRRTGRRMGATNAAGPPGLRKESRSAEQQPRQKDSGLGRSSHQHHDSHKDNQFAEQVMRGVQQRAVDED